MPTSTSPRNQPQFVVSCEDVEVRWAKRKEINQLLKQATQTRHLMSLQATDQGQVSYSTCLSEASNHFIYSGAFLTFPQYRFALRARLNLLPTRTVQARRGTIISNTCCRLCHQHPETLSHLINHCHHNLDLVREAQCYIGAHNNHLRLGTNTRSNPSPTLPVLIGLT